MAYIDVDKFAEEICKFPAIDEHSANAVISLLRSQPTADVAEVVSCSECKHLIVHNLPTVYASCIRCCFRFEPFQLDTRTHFCSLGERKKK